LKLKIGDYEIPERCLRFVILYPELSSVSFAGIFVGQKERDSGAALRRLSELRAIPFEAVDKNGIGSTGICDVKDLKLVGRGTSIVKFSGRLVRPFQD
jgi:hypothetical protein